MSIYICRECKDAAFQAWSKKNEEFFHLKKEEVEYIVKNIQHEYLNKDTYYFASDLFGRMEKFVKEADELARRNGKTT